jgi:class 3 adenylate cyclase/predicted ATPase
MLCSKCQHENREGAIFCSECATKLQQICPECGAGVEPTAKFCDNCGAPITKQSPSTSLSKPIRQDETQVKPPLSTPAAPEAEHRQLTVMFCDLVGSTPLSQQLDPEELRNVVRDYQSICEKVISLYEGHIAQYLGDGILVYFGYPQAHEDDAQRAVRTGLGIVEAIEQRNTRIQQNIGAETGLAEPLQVRIGIHTGFVVVGEIGGGERPEQLALGDTPIIASRLQGIASPNGVVVSVDTYRLIEGFFFCRDMGSQRLKGISQPMEIFQVTHESMARSRLEVLAVKGLTPLVGREQEVRLLFERWEQVVEGMGQVILLSGEAGIGKSRLVQVLKEQVAEDPQAWLTEFRCSPYYKNSVFYPVIDVFERVVFQTDRSDSPEEKLSKLEGYLVRYGLSLEEAMPLFTSLLSLPLPERYPTLTLTPEMQKQKTMEALLTLFLRRSAMQPLLFVVEDLHWIDPSTLEFISLLVDREPTTRILTLLAYRPTFNPPWIMHGHLTLLTLNRLTRRKIGEMVEKVTGSKALPTEVLDQIVTKTDGVPLFVEELTKMVIDSGLLKEGEENYELTGPLPSLAIPATLQDSLMARLDRQPKVKEVAQLGAVLGREFTYEMLQAISPMDEATLQDRLARLVDIELLYQKGRPPHSKYIFKHALIQDVAYASLLKSTRQQAHQQIAQLLEAQFSDIVETQPELLAYHLTEAGLLTRAIPYWLDAGRKANAKSANVEAIAHLRRGIDLEGDLQIEQQRSDLELDLQIELASACIPAHGYAGKKTEQAYARARDLLDEAGQDSRQFAVLFGLFVVRVNRMELIAAVDVAQELLDRAITMENSAAICVGHRSLAVAFNFMGKFAAASEHATRALNFFDPDAHRDAAIQFGHCIGVAAQMHQCLAAWYLGYTASALQAGEEGMSLARDRDHANTTAYAYLWMTYTHLSARDMTAAYQWAEEMVRFTDAQGQGMTFWSGWGRCMLGSSMAGGDQSEVAIGHLNEGLSILAQARTRLLCPTFLAFKAEALAKLGELDEAIRLLDEQQHVIETTGERWWEAEGSRIRGEIILKQSADDNAEVEQHFKKALDIASRQQAKSLELRAAMSLSRLWQSQGKKEEAQRLLSEIYDWFAEGFDTADLQDAKVLLDELS